VGDRKVGVKERNIQFPRFRAMELGRECMKLWGYRLVDEIVWVKTNQLQRIIRTGRTGSWPKFVIFVVGIKFEN
jgi:N6-adenosine-specific RNA methylase IME4